MKKSFIIIAAAASLLATTAMAQSSAEAIMDLLPEFPSEELTQRIAVAGISSDDPDAEAGWDKFFDELGTAIEQAEEASSAAMAASYAASAASAAAQAMPGMMGGAASIFTPEEIIAMSKMSEEEIMAFVLKKRSMTVQKPLPNQSELDARTAFLELSEKIREMPFKPDQIIQQGEQKVTELWEQSYKADYDKACEEMQAIWDKYGEDQEGAAEYGAAIKKVNDIKADFSRQSYLIRRSSVLEAMNFIKDEYIPLSREYTAAAAAIGSPIPGQDIELAISYLERAKELKYPVLPFNE